MNYCIILAAGNGSRMKTRKPKCLHTILGKEMINYVIDAAKIPLIDKIICILNNDNKDEVLNSIGNIEYCIQKYPLGTANAVLTAKSIIDYDGYTIILPSDIPLINKNIINDLITSHIENNNNLTIGTFKTDNPFGYGRIIKDKNGSIIKIKEELELDEIEKTINECNSGIFCIDNSLMINNLLKINNNNKKEEYYLTDIVSIMHKGYKKIGSYEIENNKLAMGVNTLFELRNASLFIKEYINNNHLNNGVIIEDIDVEIGPDVILEPNTIIKKGSIILDKSIIKEGSIIGPYSEIINSEIQNNTIINKSSIYNSKVGSNCVVGPYTHIRCNTQVLNDVRIGNFVEIKNSHIGINTKASHLSYIGDAIIGNNVNFGCGSITVNYDGLNKNKTVIGNDAFIGCNSNLIAPIKIGSNTYIAAGSTITKDLNNDDFAIARAHQIIKNNYKTKNRE